jgi:hypothetical protein
LREDRTLPQVTPYTNSLHHLDDIGQYFKLILALALNLNNPAEARQPRQEKKYTFFSCH